MKTIRNDVREKPTAPAVHPAMQNGLQCREDSPGQAAVQPRLMRKSRQKRICLLILSVVLILCGSSIVFSAFRKTVKIILDGKQTIVTTRALRVADVLKSAGVDFSSADRIRPGLTEKVHDGSSISLNRAIRVHLDPGNGLDTLTFITHQHFGGNILLDAGIRLFPGDRLDWKGTELRPDFDLSGIKELDLHVETADSFTLITENQLEGKIVHGSGVTVFDALLSAGVSVSKSMIIVPDGDSPFESGMIIEVMPLHDLLISKQDVTIPTISFGATVGEALARAGMPLMGSDVSIPSAGDPIPADGQILIVPVNEMFSMEAEIIHRETDWTANDELDLDQTRLISDGNDGLRGVFSRTRFENGEIALTETSTESVLVSPVNEKREYGTKINIRTLDTPEGPVEYYRAVRVYATSYSPCRSGTTGCITGTASGMKVQKGVAAVTSAWYQQFGGQSVYIPDYGKAVIADVGGGIPGRYWIDLAYDDDNFEGWSRETTLYFLTPVPADMVWVLQ